MNNEINLVPNYCNGDYEYKEKGSPAILSLFLLETRIVVPKESLQNKNLPFSTADYSLVRMKILLSFGIDSDLSMFINSI